MLKKSKRVTARSLWGLGIGAALFAFGLLVFFQEQAPGEGELADVIASFVFATSGVATMFWAGLRSVTADAKGLTWRNLWSKGKVAWEDITDFYTVLPSESNGHTENIARYEVVTRDGKTLFRFTADWAKAQEIRDRIAECAINATAAVLPDGTRGWEAKGARPTELPISFLYEEAELQKQEKWAALLVLLKYSLYTLMIVPPLTIIGVRLPLSLSPYPVTSGLLLLVGSLLLGMAVVDLWLWWRGWKARRETRGRIRRGEQFEATHSGLSFRQDGETRFAPWESLAGYDFVLQSRPTNNGHIFSNATTNVPAPVGRIRTVDGKEFPVTNRLSQFPLLQRLLRRYAPDAIEAHIAANNREALGGVAARWTGGEEGKGNRQFHKKTRKNRTLMLLTAGFGIMGLALAFLLIARSRSPADYLFYLLLAAVEFGHSIILAIQMRLSRLEFREKVISLVDFPTKRQDMAWSEISTIESEGPRLILTGTDGAKLIIIPRDYAYGSEIRGQIEERMQPFQKRITQGDVPNNYQMPEEKPVIQQVGVRGG